MKAPLARIALGLAVLACSRAAGAQVTYEACGTLVADATCPMVFVNDGGFMRLALANYGSFTLGSRVHVVGTLGPSGSPCSSPCLAGNTIDACAPCNCRPTCFADQGLPCPCGGQFACANSINSAGGQLAVDGGASISDDDLRFYPWRMTGYTSVYFQGTVAGESIFGEGKLCTGTPLVRIATRSMTSGQSQYPRPGEPRISVVGGVTTPGVRCYQVWYRDTAPFCTSATFNLTHAVEITWAP